MIKTIDTVLESLGLGYTDSNVQIIKEYALSIIQECVDNAEYSMEDDDELNEGSSKDDLGRDLVHPVLHRESINRVKQQII